MSITSFAALAQAKCTPCEGGIPRFSKEESAQQLQELVGWKLSEDHKSIGKVWNCGNFEKALLFANQIGELAEAEQHHPDLHLTGYRHLKVVLTTHAIDGLSSNDFILAAKIEHLPMATASSP